MTLNVLLKPLTPTDLDTDQIKTNQVVKSVLFTTKFKLTRIKNITK